ncbi:MAG: hypothetical protein EOO43_13975 [Flavobacterium sp.]|nr:MAG: hypothetical protein EOO43_13975 [Flavobacterium sp.]
MKPKKYVCTFADTRLREGLLRFEREARNMEAYDGIFLYDETMFEEQFYKHFQDKFSHRFGYFVWKPQIILQSLEKINDGDILQYTDMGCHLNKFGGRRLQHYFELVSNSPSGLLGFQTNYKENSWTKADLFSYFGFNANSDIGASGQVCATFFFIKKSEASVNIMREWLSVFYYDFSLVDDSESLITNIPEFIEHRSDQSIFSLLAKKYQFSLLSYVKEGCNFYGKYPILALRDRGAGEKWYRALQYPAIFRVLIMEKPGLQQMKILMRVIVGERLFRKLKRLAPFTKAHN